MDSLATDPALSPRGRREWDGPLSSMRRQTSNIFPASDDILAADPAMPPRLSLHNPDTRSSTSPSMSNSATTHAYVAHGRFVIRFGPFVSRDRLRAILRSVPQPALFTTRESDSPEPAAALNGDMDAPSSRGTYSKEQTLRHPEIKWVHRGQGRYVPAAQIKPEPVLSPQRPTRHAAERTSSSAAVGSDAFDQMTAALHQAFAVQRTRANPYAGERWAPQLKGQLNRVIDTLKATPRSEWESIVDVIDFQQEQYQPVYLDWLASINGVRSMNGSGAHEARSSRASRQTRTSAPSVEHRRSTRLVDAPSYGESDEEADESDDSHDQRTYDKSHAQANPGLFYHVGNGRYKRRSVVLSVDTLARTDSSASQALKSTSSEMSHSPVDDQSVHKENLYEHPGKVFHHKGNGYYRPGVGPYGKNGTVYVLANGEHRSLNQLPQAQVDKILAESSSHKPKVNPATTSQAPERTSGRVRRQSTLFGADPDFAPSGPSEKRVSRAENSFPSKELSSEMARDDARRQRGSKQSIESDLSARNVLSKQTSRSSNGSMRPDREELFDSAYVEKHPNEIFHHRGQGRWARGLPPPGSSSKMAVRGLGAKELMEAREKGEDVDEDGNGPPGITQLVLKAETEKWPNIKFYYRGGGKWWRLPPPGQQPPPPKKQRLANGSRARGEGLEAQLQREALASDSRSGAPKIKLAALKPPERLNIQHKRNQPKSLPFGGASKASSNSESKAPTPKPTPLPPDEDKLTEADLPELYKDAWSDEEDLDLEDEAARILRDPDRFRPIVGAEPFVRALTKHNPAVRSLESLKSLAANAQNALMMLQNEYLDLDKIIARNPMNGKKERKPVQGGREPVEHQAWEDRKEAALYDYAFDPRRIGYQDPDSQKIVRDAEGRELRRRRNRADPHATQVNYGDGEVTTRRIVKPVSRFDGVVVQPPRKRSRLSTQNEDELDTGAAGENTPRGSLTPERANTPVLLDPENYVPPSRGRWKGHVPKRIQELRGESVSSARSDKEKDSGTSGSSSQGARKGRPPGSKNHAKRRDAGIKKGPRKPKNSPSGSVERETPTVESLESEEGLSGMRGREQARTHDLGRPPPPPPSERNPMSLQAIMEPMPTTA